MIYHYCSSRGKNCGIASFTERIDSVLGDKSTKIGQMSPSKNGRSSDDILITEHEYGLHNNIDIDWIKSFPGKKVVIMHAFATNKQHEHINKTILEINHIIIFLTKTCKMKAASLYPEYMHKMDVLPHYCEDLIGTPKLESIAGRTVLGIHGFAFPRNGFTRFLNWYVHNAKRKFDVYIMSSLSNFNKVAEMETGVYIDKLKRIIWDNKLEDHVTIDFAYHETKQQVIKTLREKCSVLLHLTTPAKQYYNASGSVNTLLATGRPVIALESVFTESLLPESYVPIKDLSDLCVDPDDIKWDPARVFQYHETNSVTIFVKNMLNIIS